MRGALGDAAGEVALCASHGHVIVWRPHHAIARGGRSNEVLEPYPPA